MIPREKPAPLRDDSPAQPLPFPAGMEAAALVPLADPAADAIASTASAPCPFCGGEVTPHDVHCPRCAARVVAPGARPMDRLRASARTVYVLQLTAFVCGITAIPGLLMAYSNRGQARDTWLDSHYEWQIDTFWGMFWYGLAGSCVLGLGQWLLGDALLGRAPGMLVTFAAIAWYVSRVVKGWSRLADDDPVTDY